MSIAIAIGLPVLVLINRQASSQAQLLLDQSVIASRAFIESEQSNLQSLALLVSQRPTLLRYLEEQNFASLGDYLNTLREGANLDLVLVCSDGKDVTGSAQNTSISKLCLEESPSGSGYAADVNHDLYMYSWVNLQLSQDTQYKVIASKKLSLILTDLQNETSLHYFLTQQNKAIGSSDPTFEISSASVVDMLKKANQGTNVSLEKRSLEINGHRYLPAVFELDPSLDLDLISALNVDDQINIQQSLSRTLVIGLFFVVLIVSALGVWQAQRISRPIVSLADSAANFRQGNLHAPLSIQSSISEINQLTNTLEDARVALEHTMKQFQAEKDWIENLLNSIVEGMLTLDNQNRITFASAGVSQITGYERDQIIGQKVDSVFLPTDREVAFSAQLPDAGQQRRVSAKLKNGQEVLLSISKANLIPPEANSANQALVIRDVTNEEYIHRLLGDFMANVTHEFRTPLAALEASSELLLDNLHSLSHAEIEELLTSLNLGIINLQTLIDNLIEAASIEAGRFKVQIRDIPFAAIYNEAQGMIHPLVKKYGLQLVSKPVSESIHVLADQRRTVQVLVNLLSNAIKHSPENGVIRIDHYINDRALCIEVIDQGGGVPMDQRKDLFRRFAHLETTNERARQGAGLGLSVVKAIIEAQQGEVGIKDLPNGGNSFWFTLTIAGGK
ncbi:MAG TPA: ATP-binding protein [Anaerolineales bacterium]|nr:ATP-binding protein [Anaerolineales bacterium]